MSIRARIEKIFTECEPGAWGVSGVTSWEKDRMFEWRGRDFLSERQKAVLEDVERKVHGAVQDDEDFV